MCRQRNSRTNTSATGNDPQEMNEMERGHLLPSQLPLSSHHSVQLGQPATTPPGGWFTNPETIINTLD